MKKLKYYFNRCKQFVKYVMAFNTPPKVKIIKSGDIVHKEKFENQVVIMEYPKQKDHTEITFCDFHTCTLMHVNEKGNVGQGLYIPVYRTEINKIPEPEKVSEELQMQVVDEFIDHLRVLVDYWEIQPDQTSKQKLEGLTHSILCTLDGCSGGFDGLLHAWRYPVFDDV